LTASRAAFPGTPGIWPAFWVFDHDFFLLLNVAVGGVASRPPDSSTSFPQVMLVDCVRGYAPPG